mmetsp:Transcript_8073/g.17651  ORF Transcript_8073/g.17651 Transcript_8073/m.17651 type:complete len:370 (-) Transcript_8073:75-1184(-)
MSQEESSEGADARKGRRKTTKNFTDAEDVALTKAWLTASSKPITGTEGKSTFWINVHEVFTHQFGGGREISSLINRWSTIRAALGKFSGLYFSAKQVERRGWNDEHYTDAALQMWQARNQGKTFPYTAVWRLVRHHPKWTVPTVTRAKLMPPNVPADVRLDVSLEPSRKRLLGADDDDITVSSADERPLRDLSPTYAHKIAKKKAKDAKIQREQQRSLVELTEIYVTHTLFKDDQTEEGRDALALARELMLARLERHRDIDPVDMQPGPVHPPQQPNIPHPGNLAPASLVPAHPTPIHPTPVHQQPTLALLGPALSQALPASMVQVPVVPVNAPAPGPGPAPGGGDADKGKTAAAPARPKRTPRSPKRN